MFIANVLITKPIVNKSQKRVQGSSVTELSPSSWPGLKSSAWRERGASFIMPTVIWFWSPTLIFCDMTVSLNVDVPLSQLASYFWWRDNVLLFWKKIVILDTVLRNGDYWNEIEKWITEEVAEALVIVKTGQDPWEGAGKCPWKQHGSLPCSQCLHHPKARCCSHH